VGAAANHGNALKEKITGNCKIPQKQQIMEFGLDILRSLDAAPTAWYKGGHFTENTGYKLALISQPVFFGKRTKLQICPPKVDPEASLSNTNLTSPLPIDTLITPLPHINGSYYI